MTLAHVLILASCAACIECFVWCLRWRGRRNAPVPSPMELVLLFIVVGLFWWAVDGMRLAAWLLRNLIEWGIRPALHGGVVDHAQARWADRKARKLLARSQHATTAAGALALGAGAVRRRPPPPQPALPPAAPLALPAPAAQPVLPEGELVVGPDGQVCAVQQLPDGRQLVTPMMRGFS